MNDAMRRKAIVLALAFTLAPVYAQQPQPLNPPLKNWTAPLSWAPTPREAEQQRIEQRIAHPEASSSAIAQASIFTAPGPMTFIAMTPCRVMDTRSSQPFTGAFGPPSLAAYVTRQVPMPSSSCNIPSTAGAYSLNVTVVPPGALSFLTVWPAGQSYPGISTLNDPVSGGVIANAAIVVAGTSGAIQMVAGNPTDVIIDINGYYAAPSDPNFLSDTGVGYGVLANNVVGQFDTAIGTEALNANTAGSSNTAIGADALQSNTGGNGNTGTGISALKANTTGSLNTATGAGSLANNTTGSNNTASGQAALYSNTIGINSTAVGYQAQYNNLTGNNNIAIGYLASFNVSNGNSNNIDIGSEGVAGDGAAANSGVIRIGTAGTQTSAFIAGISGATPGTPNLLVCADGNGQLGTSGCGSTPSSLRFKKQITDMGGASSKLFQLRPVTFLYKPEYDDGSHALQYGLIAEEVAKLYPEMVGYDAEGQPSSVKYQSLAPLLLNEVQKQNAHIQSQAEAIQAQQEENRQQTEQIRSLADRLAALEALLSTQTATGAKTGGSQ